MLCHGMKLHESPPNYCGHVTYRSSAPVGISSAVLCGDRKTPLEQDSGTGWHPEGIYAGALFTRFLAFTPVKLIGSATKSNLVVRTLFTISSKV